MSDMGHGQSMEHGTHGNQDLHGNHGGHGSHERMSHGKPIETKGGWADAGTPSGHRALKYADLRFRGVQKNIRSPEREIILTLGGNMERFIWTINGKKFDDPDFEPIKVKYGERVRLKFINETMMVHPMHLHGMFIQPENGQPAEKLPNKHTLNIPPGQTYSVLLTANEPGEWAFHCHMLYHMEAGMMTKLIVSDAHSLQKTPSPSVSSEVPQSLPVLPALKTQVHGGALRKNPQKC